MTASDTMDVLTGFAILAAMILAAAAWVYTVSEWDLTFNASVAPLVVKAPAPAPSPTTIV
jgi:hypothetical protein